MRCCTSSRPTDEAPVRMAHGVGQCGVGLILQVAARLARLPCAVLVGRGASSSDTALPLVIRYVPGFLKAVPRQDAANSSYNGYNVSVASLSMGGACLPKISPPGQLPSTLLVSPLVWVCLTIFGST